MMLSERKLIAASIAVSVIGIALLFLISSVMESPRASPAEAAKKGSGKVTVSGFVMDYSDRGSYAAIELAGTETVEAVSFDAEAVRKLGLKRLQTVEVTGEIRQFNGRSSIVISRIKAANRSFGCDG